MYVTCLIKDFIGSKLSVKDMFMHIKYIHEAMSPGANEIRHLYIFANIYNDIYMYICLQIY